MTVTIPRSQWSYIAPPAEFEPSGRTSEYWAAEGELLATDDGERHISLFAIAFVHKSLDTAVNQSYVGAVPTSSHGYANFEIAKNRFGAKFGYPVGRP